MNGTRRQAGDGKIGCIFWLLVLVAAGLFAFEWVPVRIASAEFRDFMTEQAKFAQRASADTLKRRLLQKATELKLPIDKDDCVVEKPGDRIRMKCSYDVELEFPGYTHVWHFDEEIDEAFYIF